MSENLSRNGIVIVTKTEINSSKTMEGNLIHIEDAAPINVEECITTLEPIQDLHGYSKPWPAGGGSKNLLPIATTTSTVFGITYTINNDGTITLNGTNTATSATTDFRLSSNIVLPSGNYIINGGNDGLNGSNNTLYLGIDNAGSTRYVGTKNNDTSFTINDGDTVSCFIRVAKGATANNIVFKPMIRLASNTDPTFEPYSNECPISGHTGVELTRTGKNLFDKSSTPINAYISMSNVITGTSNDRVVICKVMPNTQYTISFTRTAITGTDDYQIAYCKTAPKIGDTVMGFIRGTMRDFNQITITTNNDGYYLLIKIAHTSKTNFENTVATLQVEKGSTATSYESYQSEPHSITFPQEQSPVYGCKVDWINGILKVTEVSAIYDGSTDEGWSNRTATSGANLFEIQVPNMYIPQSASQIGKCNLFPWLITLATDKTYRLMSTTLTIHYDGITLSEWKNILAQTPLQITYPLTTPLEIPLTPEVITLLRGENNIWTNVGTTTLTYQPDNVVGELKGEIQLLQSQINTLINQLNSLSN